MSDAHAETKTTTVKSWDNDPETGNLLDRPVPDLAAAPLALKITAPAPPPGVYPTTSPDFRYWTAAEALRRAASFWGPRVPGGKWELGAIMPVLLDEGEDLNAYYDRKALNFFHGPGAKPGTVVYSGESADVVCHELGHAILDSIKPQLWNAAGDEIAAFHESFGDMSAILAALQLSEMRKTVLAETSGHLDRNSRLSRLAEQLGGAIRRVAPQAVDPDCLRNAANRFTYQNPAQLPASAPAAQLSSEPHSFSRLFTGAFLEVLAAIAAAGRTTAPTEADVLRASGELGDILVAGVKAAAVVPNFYAQVAAGMVHASAAINPAYPNLLRGVFVRRGILSIASASDVVTNVAAAVGVAAAAAAPAAPDEGPLTKLALPGRLFGLGETAVLVEAPSQPRRFSALSAAPGLGSEEAPSSEAAARVFLEGLIRRDRVEHEQLEAEALTARPFHARRKSHKLRQSDAGLVLERRWFDCGFCGR